VCVCVCVCVCVSSDVRETDALLTCGCGQMPELKSGHASDHIHILTHTELVRAGHAKSLQQLNIAVGRLAFLPRIREVPTSMSVWMYGILVFGGVEGLQTTAGTWASFAVPVLRPQKLLVGLNGVPVYIGSVINYKVTEEISHN
jgi:hypothetical protein